MALAIFFYCAPLIAVATIGGVAIGRGIRHGSVVDTNRLALEVLALALFWPGGLIFWRYKSNGRRMEWWLLPTAILFYFGFVAADLAWDDEDLWFS